MVDEDVSWQVPHSRCLPQLFQAEHVCGQRLAISKLYRPVTAFGIEEVEQSGSASFIGILADVTRILRLLQVSGHIKLDHVLVGGSGFIGVGNVRHHGIFGSLLSKFSLGQREPGTRLFTLAAIKKSAAAPQRKVKWNSRPTRGRKGAYQVRADPG